MAVSLTECATCKFNENGTPQHFTFHSSRASKPTVSAWLWSCRWQPPSPPPMPRTTLRTTVLSIHVLRLPWAFAAFMAAGDVRSEAVTLLPATCWIKFRW